MENVRQELLLPPFQKQKFCVHCKLPLSVTTLIVCKVLLDMAQAKPFLKQKKSDPGKYNPIFFVLLYKGQEESHLTMKVRKTYNCFF